MRKVALLPTRDGEAGYGPYHSDTCKVYFKCSYKVWSVGYGACESVGGMDRCV